MWGQWYMGPHNEVSGMSCCCVHCTVCEVSDIVGRWYVRSIVCDVNEMWGHWYVMSARYVWLVVFWYSNQNIEGCHHWHHNFKILEISPNNLNGLCVTLFLPLGVLRIADPHKIWQFYSPNKKCSSKKFHFRNVVCLSSIISVTWSHTLDFLLNI